MCMYNQVGQAVDSVVAGRSACLFVSTYLVSEVVTQDSSLQYL